MRGLKKFRHNIIFLIIQTIDLLYAEGYREFILSPNALSFLLGILLWKKLSHAQNVINEHRIDI